MSKIRNKVIFTLILTGLNSEFSFSETVIIPRLESQFALLFTHCRKRIIGFIPFPTILIMQCEM